jgi:hypothetical protein
MLSSSFSKVSILSIKSRLFVLTSYILHLFEIIRSILSKKLIEKETDTERIKQNMSKMCPRYVHERIRFIAIGLEIRDFLNFSVI